MATDQQNALCLDLAGKDVTGFMAEFHTLVRGSAWGPLWVHTYKIGAAGHRSRVALLVRMFGDGNASENIRNREPYGATCLAIARNKMAYMREVLHVLPWVYLATIGPRVSSFSAVCCFVWATRLAGIFVDDVRAVILSFLPISRIDNKRKELYDGPEIRRKPVATLRDLL